MIYRNTVQRAMTLEAVRRLHAHPTAEEVYRQVAAEHPSVSRATVYRNLRQLAEIAGEEPEALAERLIKNAEDFLRTDNLRTDK